MKTHYWVAVDAAHPNADRFHKSTLSRVIGRLGTLRRVLKRVRRRIPQAYGIGETIFR